MPTGDQDLTTTEDGSYYLNGAISQREFMAVTRKTNALYVIPTEDEWYNAAYHKKDGVTGNYWDYPTGSDAVPSNDSVDPDPGNNANFDQSGYTIGSPYYRTEAGEFEDSESPYGTFDQGGNVWEWNEAIVGELYRGLRGGSFGDGSVNYLRASARTYILIYPTDEPDFVRFRVCEVFGPVSTEAPRVEGSRDTPEAAGPE